MLDGDVSASADARLNARPGAVARVRQGMLARVTAVVLLLVGFGAGAGADRIGLLGQSAVNASSSLVDTPAFKTFQQAWDVVHANYIDIAHVDDKTLIYGAATGMVAALNDTGHSTFFTPEQAASFKEQQSSQFVGVGIQISNTTGKWLILAVYSGSPADKAGLKIGDEITYVGDKPVEGLIEADIGALLKGAIGTSVQMTVHRGSTNADITVKMTREKITYKLVNWTMLPNNVAFVQLLQFNAGASLELKGALDEASAAGATSIIFDLRGNPGGLGLEAVKVASVLLPEGSTVYQEQDSPNGPKYSQKTIGRSNYTTQPMVVLIDQNTASAAEIISASLRDNHRATLVGETTVGTGTGTTTFPLDDGSEVDLGVSFWFTPTGQSVWRVGVKPNQEVALPAGTYGLTPGAAKNFTTKDLAAATDAQLKTAYDVLTSTSR